MVRFPMGYSPAISLLLVVEIPLWWGEKTKRMSFGTSPWPATQEFCITSVKGKVLADIRYFSGPAFIQIGLGNRPAMVLRGFRSIES